MDLTERKIEEKEIYNGKIMHVFCDTVQLPNGQTAKREYMRHVGAVCIVPLNEKNEILMERQFRYALGRVVLEIPAGKLNDPHEDRLLAAQRELREETGITAQKWDSLGLFFPACAYSDEKIEMFLAREPVFGAQQLDEDEFLDLEWIALPTLTDMVMRGEITDAKTQTAILKTKLFLERE